MPRRHALLTLFVLALLVRLAAALVVGIDGPLVEDERGYAAVADALADGRGFELPVADRMPRHEPLSAPPRTSFRAPLLPLLLAPLAALDAPAIALRLVSVLLGAASVALLYWAARDGPLGRWAWLVGLAYAVWPPAVYLSLKVLSEPLGQVLLLGAIGLTLRAEREESARPALAAGLLGGLAVLARPALLPVLLLLPFGTGRRSRGILLLIALLATLAPWLLRSMLRHDRPLLTTNSGVTLVGGNSEAALHADPPGKWVPPERVYAGHADPPDLGMWGWSRLGEAASDARFRRDALDWLASHPLEALQLCGSKCVRLFDPDPHSAKPDAGVKRLIGWLSLAPVLLLALVGVRAFVASGPAAWPWCAALFGTVLVAAVFYGDARMRTAADPALLVLAAFGARSARTRFVPRRKES
jgi:hypothetical protein